MLHGFNPDCDIADWTFTVNFSNCQCGFCNFEYKLTVNVHLCIRLTRNITKVVKKHTFIEF